MSTRITVFAVDIVAFAEFLRRPLWRVLVDARRTAPETEVMFSVWKGPRLSPWGGPSQHYGITKDRRLYHSYGTGRSESRCITDDEAAADPQLQESVGDYLPTQSTFGLEFLLYDLNEVHHAEFIHEVSRGDRRYWIGSLLGTAHELWHNTPPFRELAGYFARILRGHDCFFPVKPHEKLSAPADFPVIPQDDGQPGMAAFDEAESTRLIELLDMVVQCEPTFRPPPLWTSSADIDWDSWVREMASACLAVHDLHLPNMNLVTFIT